MSIASLEEKSKRAESFVNRLRELCEECGVMIALNDPGSCDEQPFASLWAIGAPDSPEGGEAPELIGEIGQRDWRFYVDLEHEIVSTVGVFD